MELIRQKLKDWVLPGSFHEPGWHPHAKVTREGVAMQNLHFDQSDRSLDRQHHGRRSSLDRRRQSIGDAFTRISSFTGIAGGGSITHIPENLVHWEIPVNINEKTEVEHQIEKLVVRKAELTFARLCFLGLLSGVWMVLSACCAMTAAAAVGPAITEEFPIARKAVLGFFAPVAMHFIVVFGGEFFSGNCMYFCVGLLKERVTPNQAAFNLFWVTIWNALGCVCACYFCAYSTKIFAEEPFRSFVIGAAEDKAKLSWFISLIRAIPANILICTSIQMGISARDMTGKIIALHMPLTVYTVAGFEHSITNLVIVPLGVMYGADVDVGAWMWSNLIPSLIGNFIGGGLIVGGFVTLLYSWDENGHGNLNIAMPVRRRASLVHEHMMRQASIWKSFVKSGGRRPRMDYDSGVRRLKDARHDLLQAKHELENMAREEEAWRATMQEVTGQTSDSAPPHHHHHHHHAHHASSSEIGANSGASEMPRSNPRMNLASFDGVLMVDNSDQGSNSNLRQREPAAGGGGGLIEF